ncbi:MAG TPA: trypsin-like peptidase domain-containing protein [Bdellovibrionales bacterium]|nr:trypsin-like peptidase domain-containing protein [Bdellovibrionales bacterium]
MRSLIVGFILFLVQVSSSAAELEPALRIAVQVDRNGKLSSNNFCSGSVVEIEGDLHLMTAKHCLKNENPKGMYPDTVQRVRQYQANGEKASIELWAQSWVPEGPRQAFSFSEEKFEGLDGDGAQVLLPHSRDQMNQRQVKVLSLAKEVPKPGSTVQLRGFPISGTFEALSCRVTSSEEFTAQLSKRCSLPPNYIENTRAKTGPFMLVSCPSRKSHPMGMSGGPVLDDEGRFVGVIASAPADPQGGIDSGEWGADLKKRRECYPEWSRLFFIRVYEPRSADIDNGSNRAEKSGAIQ